MRPLTTVVVMVAAAMVAGDELDCITHTDCQDCIRVPSCVWCNKMDDGSGALWSGPRCLWEESPNVNECGGDTYTPNSGYSIIQDEAFRKFQIKPQEVDLALRVGEPWNLTLTYKQLNNYPVDLYYLMDGSQSLSDDKDMLEALVEELVNKLSKITTEFQLGFGTFVDKPIAPYASSKQIMSDNPPYVFKHALPLTNDSALIKQAVSNTEVAGNLDDPESGLDALVQVIVCEADIGWRSNSLKVVFLATDAGFHLAGDGRLAGILTPNDLKCHLDAENIYPGATLDYPSIGQIKDVVREQSMNLIFASTNNVQPLYTLLARSIPGSVSGNLASDSSNVVELLDKSILDIISRVELQQKRHNNYVSVRYFSRCTERGEEKERSTCTDVGPGRKVEFKVEFTLNECPENEAEWQQVVEVSPVGRKGSLKVNLKMACKCKCDEVGDTGYLVNAPECNRQGDLSCSKCLCHEGYLGDFCQCDAKGLDSTWVVDDKGCIDARNVTCSNRGICECGQCKCNKRPNPEEIISGSHCECTNYENCGGVGGLLCSGHGRCECSRCRCEDGWSGDRCGCDNSEDNCRSSGSEEVCSGHGSCECNRCSCNGEYFGRFCEDCPDCSGKCTEYKACVQCVAFDAGDLRGDQCRFNCSNYNITVVEEAKVEKAGEKFCSFYDENKCRFHFVYQTSSPMEVMIRVQEELDCPKPINILAVILGVLIPIVLIGILTLIIWKVYAVIQDRKEVAQFILNLGDEKWVENTNPLYRGATTTVQNPLFGTSS